MSESYPHIAGSCTARSLRLYTASLNKHARGAGVQRASHGRSGRVARTSKGNAQFQGTLERTGRKGPRGQTDQREIQPCVATTPHNSRLTMKKKAEGECGRITQDRLLQKEIHGCSRALHVRCKRKLDLHSEQGIQEGSLNDAQKQSSDNTK